MNRTATGTAGTADLEGRPLDYNHPAADQWGCARCGAAFFGPEPADELCPDCRPPEVIVLSFGYGHRQPPPAHLLVDVRHHYRDPHVSPGLRELTGGDDAVISAVLTTPGVPELIEATSAAARAFLAGPSAGRLVVAVGCAGGRHRSVVIADAVARNLDTIADHLDIGRPVIRRPTSAAPAARA